MAYKKSSSTHYINFGGVNEKASEYTTNQSQALNLRNIDFYVPNAWSKTPGSTQSIGTGTSGTIRSLHEFEKLDGQSWIVSGSNEEINISNGTTGWSSISSGWTNGQPEDMVTFLNKCWIANGQHLKSFDGSDVVKYGLPGPVTTLDLFGGNTAHVTSFNVLGESCHPSGTNQDVAMLWTAYRYVRDDGYMGPLNFYEDLGNPSSPYQNGISPVGLLGYTEGTCDYGVNITLRMGGISLPSASDWPGITAVAIYFYVDVFKNNNNEATIADYPSAVSIDNSDTFDPTIFRHVTTTSDTGNISFLSLPPWSDMLSSATFPAFSGMAAYHFATYTPKYIEVHNNRLFQSGFSAAPSTVFFPEVGNPEVLDETSFFEPRTDDGDRITGKKSFQNQLLIFKRRSFHKLIGSSADNYRLVELTSEYGCLSNKAIVEYDNRLLFLDQEGIVEYNGANWQIISTPIEDTFRRMNVSAAIDQAIATHYIERNQVWFAIPVDGSSENNLTVVYDYLLQAWTFIDGFNPSAFAPIKQGLNKRTVYYGDYSGGVYHMSPSFYSYNGTAFTSVIETVFDSPDGPDVENMFRRLFLDVKTASGVTGVINVEVISNYDRDTAQATFSIFQDKFQTRADFGVPGKAAAFKMYHANVSLPLTLNGYTVHRRFLRKR